MRNARSLGMSRRQAISLLSAGAGFGLAAFSLERVAHAFQPGGWYAAKSGARVTSPKGAVIRALVEDVAPEKLTAGSTQIHEHLGGSFTPPQPPGPSDMLPGPVAPRPEAEYIDLMVEELKMSRADGVSCLVDAATGRRTSYNTRRLDVARHHGLWPEGA